MNLVLGAASAATTQTSKLSSRVVQSPKTLAIGKKISAGELLVQLYDFRVSRDFSDHGLIILRIDLRGVIPGDFFVFFFKLRVIIGLAKCRLKNLHAFFRGPRSDEIG